MQGNDHINAAEPNWFIQAHKQIDALALTLIEINEPSCDEALDALQEAINAAYKLKSE